MSLKLIEQLSLAGSDTRPNEDSFAVLEHAALVMDGATPLGPSLLPGPSDAAWIAQFGARRLSAHLKDGDSPRDALKHALEDAARSFIGLTREPIREKWQTPCASIMLAVEFDDTHWPTQPREVATALGSLGREPRPASMRFAPAGVRAAAKLPERARPSFEFLWFGDCAALVEQDGEVMLVGEALEKRKAEAKRARRIAKEKNISAAAGINRPEIEPLLRAARNRINSGSNWLFSPDVRAANHIARKTLLLSQDATLLIASDGFLALITDYDSYDAKSLMAAAKSKGLAALGHELRAIEEGDALGRKYARFKKSDDSTALLLRVG